MRARQFAKTSFHAETLIMENKRRSRWGAAFNLKAVDLAFKEGNGAPGGLHTVSSNDGETLATPV